MEGIKAVQAQLDGWSNGSPFLAGLVFLLSIFRTHDLARQKENKILKGHLQQDHVHVLISIPPKYSGAQVVGYIKGKSAIHIARTYLGQKKNYIGMSFWA